jgi:hypothetical protein
MRRCIGSVTAAVVLLVALAVPAMGAAPLYRLTAPTCVDGGVGPQAFTPSAVGSMADIREFINRQRQGGPTGVKDGICESWPGIYTIYRVVDGTLVVFQVKD